MPASHMPFRGALPVTLSILLLAACHADVVSGTPIHRSTAGEYVFPVGAEFEELEWTEFHWDGANAVDIFAAADLPEDSSDFARVSRAPVLAVADGVVQRTDNERGGIAVILQADTGKQFYYSHLEEPVIESDEHRRVQAGEQIGRIGRSGRWARFIEPHLHFEVVESWHDELGWSDTVNAARWIRRHFGAGWRPRDIRDYPADSPAGRPLSGPFTVAHSFAESRDEDPDTAAVVLEPQEVPSEAHSVLTGEITVMRGTAFGLRVQVTNRPTDLTLVYSGLASTALRTGEVVEPGSTIGTVEDALHLMYFVDGVPTDPLLIEELTDGLSGGAGSVD